MSRFNGRPKNAYILISLEPEFSIHGISSILQSSADRYQISGKFGDWAVVLIKRYCGYILRTGLSLFPRLSARIAVRSRDLGCPLFICPPYDCIITTYQWQLLADPSGRCLAQKHSRNTGNTDETPAMTFFSIANLGIQSYCTSFSVFCTRTYSVHWESLTASSARYGIDISRYESVIRGLESPVALEKTTLSAIDDPFSNGELTPMSSSCSTLAKSGYR